MLCRAKDTENSHIIDKDRLAWNDQSIWHCVVWRAGTKCVALPRFVSVRPCAPDYVILPTDIAGVAGVSPFDSGRTNENDITSDNRFANTGCGCIRGMHRYGKMKK